MAKAGDKEKPQEAIVCRNRRARHRYEILDKLEVGLALTGTEVKSLRNGKASIEESFARVDSGEVWLYNCDIPEYQQAGRFNHKPKRRRKLLLHKREIDKFVGEASQRGCTLVPLKLYFRRGYARIQLAIARGRKLHDKREQLKKKEANREIRRSVGRRR